MSIEHSTNFRRVDERVTTSGVVDAECLAGLGDEGYDVVINLMPDDSSHAVSGEAAIVAGQGVTYVPIPVDFAEPSRADLDAFFAAMDANAGKQIHVHCAVNARVSVLTASTPCARAAGAQRNPMPSSEASGTRRTTRPGRCSSPRNASASRNRGWC